MIVFKPNDWPPDQSIASSEPATWSFIPGNFAAIAWNEGGAWNPVNIIGSKAGFRVSQLDPGGSLQRC